MSLQTQRKGQIGVNAVEQIVLRDWESRWQAIDAFNDDGIDGLIFIEAGGAPTGQIVFAQVKYRNRLSTKQGRIAVGISPKKLKKSIDKWRRVVGAAILICVDPERSRVHWANLRDPRAIVKSQVFVPVTNKFDRSARRKIAALCGTINRDILLERVSTQSKDFEYLKGREHIQTLARRFYRKLNERHLHFKDSQSVLRFTREGWHHITRPDRSRMAQLQSFQLLGTLPAIVEQCAENDLRIVKSKTESAVEYAAARAAVSFDFRQTAVVTALFRRRKAENGSYSYSFHTIYEPRRKRDLVGNVR